MKKQSIKKITLSRLLEVFLVATLIIISIISLSYRNFFQFVVEKEAYSIAEIVEAGLTSHMKAGIMDKRAYFLKEISSVHDIDSIKVIRSDSVIREFGQAGSYEKRLDDDLRKILKTKKASFEWKDDQKTVEVVIPYIASSKGELNCLDCHAAKDEEVLGAIEISMDTGLYKDFIFKNSYIIAGGLLLFALVIVLNMFHVIERYIRRPLKEVINDGQEAYSQHRTIDSDKFESMEFKEVAENINDFNKNILEQEEKLKQKNIELQELNEEIESTLKETLLVIGQVEEKRSNDTKRHALRVTKICKLIAQEYGMKDEAIKLIELASPLHDIGKIGIADSILNKEDRLTQKEYDLMKMHTILGHEILKHSKRAVLQTAASIAYEHHEKYDGTGYPQGLKGEEISLYARIVSVVDVLDALLSRRVYKEKWPIDKVIKLFKEDRGHQFEPKLVDIILENIQEYAQIIHSLSEDEVDTEAGF